VLFRSCGNCKNDQFGLSFLWTTNPKNEDVNSEFKKSVSILKQVVYVLENIEISCTRRIRVREYYIDVFNIHKDSTKLELLQIAEKLLLDIINKFTAGKTWIIPSDANLKNLGIQFIPRERVLLREFLSKISNTGKYWQFTTEPEMDSYVCHSCRKNALLDSTVSLKICAKCHMDSVGYCSKECQVKDWPFHKTYCCDTIASHEYRKRRKLQSDYETYRTTYN
jgi:hypothetical protein